MSERQSGGQPGHPGHNVPRHVPAKVKPLTCAHPRCDEPPVNETAPVPLCERHVRKWRMSNG